MARAIDADALKEKYADMLSVQHLFGYDAGFVDGIRAALEMPTLTPQNEWVEALEAINNAAVAYIEGGPYENDLPGMEFAVEIDRLSRDFVRPPNEPLTFAELEKLDGQPVYIPKLHAWGLVNVSENTLYNYNGWAIKLYETSLMGVYRRPPEGEA